MAAAVPAWLLPLFHLLAFWVAVVGFRGDALGRYVLGLGIGALLARVGWGAFHFPLVVPAEPDPAALALWLLAPGGGFSLLFVALGPLVLIPSIGGANERRDYLLATSRSLPRAFAMARVGCVLVGCCSGLSRTGLGTGEDAYPTALYELVGWLVADGLLRGADSRRVPGLFLMALGGLRLLIEPLRAAPPLGEPVVGPEWIALAWLLAGAGLVLAPAGRPPAPDCQIAPTGDASGARLHE